MFGRSLMATLTLTGTLAATTAQAQDITGTWRIASSTTPDGGSYGGKVTIRPNGDCYTVDWDLDSGDHYSGIGMRAGNTLAVAYSTSQEDNYGVVLYSRNKTKGGFDGGWCQPDGSFGVENLSGNTLAGSHQLSGGNSSGTVAIESYGRGSLNYRLHWKSSSQEYDGFGTTPSDDFELLAGVWGQVEGTGVVLYSLANTSGRLPGWWAASNSGGQGLETLER